MGVPPSLLRDRNAPYVWSRNGRISAFRRKRMHSQESKPGWNDVFSGLDGAAAYLHGRRQIAVVHGPLVFHHDQRFIVDLDLGIRVRKYVGTRSKWVARKYWTETRADDFLAVLASDLHIVRNKISRQVRVHLLI